MIRAYHLYTGSDGNSHVVRGGVSGGELVDAESILFKETPAHSSFDWHNDPIPQYVFTPSHGGSSGIGNLAYPCLLCNRYKGSDIASTDRAGQPIRFFDPGRDLFGRALQIEVTARVLRLNASERVIERAWVH